MFSEYSNLIKNKTIHPLQLIRGMKSLAISKEKYYSFCKSFNNSMSIRNYKFSLVQSPKPRRINKIINLTNKIKHIPFSDTKRQNKLMRSQTQRVEKKNFLMMSKYKKKKNNIYFFVGENKFKHREESLYRLKKNKGININIKLNEEFKQNLQNLEIKNAEKRVKDFFFLLDSIFYEKNYYYNKLKYKEQEIFGHKEEYCDYLKDELNYYINKDKYINNKSELYKLFEIKKYGKIDLYLKSVRIEIVDILDKVILTIPLPFNLMLLLYLCDAKQINELLVLFLQEFNIKELLNNSYYNPNIIDEQKNKIISDILTKISIEKGKLYIDIKQKDFEKYYAKIKFLEEIKAISDSVKYKNFLNEFYKNENSIKIIDKSNYNNIYDNPNFKNISKINFETDVNKYQYYLIQEKSVYKINLIFPEIILRFNSDKRQMNRYINKELFLYLYQNNFMNWDFYIFHFLYSFKYIRRVMSGIFSVRNNKKIRFNTPEGKINFFKKINYNPEQKKENDEKYKNIFNKYNIGLNSIITFNEKKFEYDFLFVDKVNVSLFKLRSYTIYAFFPNMKKPIIYEFNFNFQQMKILYFISLFEKLKNFLLRLFFVENDEINFDYSYFDNFLTMSNHKIRKYFHDIYILKEEKDFNYPQTKEKNTKNLMSLKIVEPFVEVFVINHIQNQYKITQSNIKISSKFIEDLLKKDMKDWIYVLNKHKYSFNIKFHNKYEEMRNKKIRRKISVSINDNKGEDLGKIFNKFLKIA